LEVAAGEVQRFRDGVWLVDLTPLAEAGLVAQTIASSLGVQEGPAEPITATLVRAIQSKNMLLLDNCEHLLQACSQVVDSLLRASAHLNILITSREITGITGECVFHVPPLSMPSSTPATPTYALLEFPAIRLFVERASTVSTSFALTEHSAGSVVQICNQLDGLPLAIELAAARVNVFTPRQIARRPVGGPSKPLKACVPLTNCNQLPSAGCWLLWWNDPWLWRSPWPTRCATTCSRRCACMPMINWRLRAMR